VYIALFRVFIIVALYGFGLKQQSGAPAAGDTPGAGSSVQGSGTGSQQAPAQTPPSQAPATPPPGPKQRDLMDVANSRLQGRFTYMNTSLPAYGLGAATPTSQADLIDFTLFGFHQTARRRIGRGLFAGFGYHLDVYNDLDDTDAKLGPTAFAAYGVGTNGSSISSGVSMDQRVQSPCGLCEGQTGLGRFVSAH
jgi:hypothetical protein